MKETLIKRKKIVVFFLAVMLVFSSTFTFGSMEVSAASFTGKGTKSDPYLIQTAEQLQAISDNLSAHYKLANTIDLSGFGEFKQIGNLAKPFTGSFTCDTDSDGTPKYAIKNLTVYNHAGEKYGHQVGKNAYIDYKENNSNWDTALFGAAKGATFKNIALLNVKITNTVVGQNQMNNDWSLNPGQDEQSTGALVGNADSITVENCSATGNITSKSNNCGGLLGRIKNSTVKKSYSTVNVSGTGLWGVAGFVGSGEGNTITNCFATGNVGPGLYTVSGFTCANGKIENCYSTGTVDAEKGNSFHSTQKGSEFKNCVTLSKTTATAQNTSYAGKTVENCLVLSDGGSQFDFTKASAQQIQTVINSINSNLKVIKDTGKYVPGAVNSVGMTDNTTAQGTDSQGHIDSSIEMEEAEEKKTAEEIISLADELLEKALKKELTLEEAIEGLKLKDYYLELDDAEMEKIPDATTNSFETISEESSNVALSEITKRIKNLPSTDEISADNADEIIALWEMYDGLPGTVKEYFEPDNIKKLTECYETAENMKDLKIVTAQVDSGLTRLQNILVIVLFVLNGIALCGLFVLLIFIVKRLRKMNPRNQKVENKKVQVKRRKLDENA